jgi:membrane fusion protein
LLAKRTPPHGTVVVARPLSFLLMTLGAATLAIALVAFLTLTHYTKRNRVVGFTEPERGLIKLMAPQVGVVLERRVAEGQSVKAGEILFIVSADRVAEGGAGGANAAALMQLRSRKQSLADEQDKLARITQQQEFALANRAGALRLEIASLDREIATQRRRIELAQEKFQRFNNLQRENFVSPAALAERQEEIVEHQARLQAFERNRIGIGRELSQVQAELTQVPLRAQREVSALERNLLSVEQEQVLMEAQRQMLVTAPADGVITTVLAEPGQTVGSGPLATLVPANTRLMAVLFAPSRAAGFIEPGQTVRVRYAAYPYQKFGQHEGVVQQISRSAMTPQELPQLLAGAIAQAEPMVRITVALASESIQAYGQPQALTPGMQLEADVLQDTRRLIEWVFEPLFSLRGKV